MQEKNPLILDQIPRTTLYTANLSSSKVVTAPQLGIQNLPSLTLRTPEQILLHRLMDVVKEGFGWSVWVSALATTDRLA